MLCNHHHYLPTPQNSVIFPNKNSAPIKQNRPSPPPSGYLPTSRLRGLPRRCSHRVPVRLGRAYSALTLSVASWGDGVSSGQGPDLTGLVSSGEAAGSWGPLPLSSPMHDRAITRNLICCHLDLELFFFFNITDRRCLQPLQLTGGQSRVALGTVGR